MKTQWYAIFSMIIMMVGCASSSGIQGNWEKLGQRTVNYGLDKDEIKVTAREGKFKAIKLAFRGGKMNMHRCVIHYANGEKQNVALKKQYSAGDETRTIDLKGNRRVISKVVFWYDTKNLARKKAIIGLWGLH
ncbi:MAG: DUF2541 family protein [Saprospiraceae bacterium]|nr:DUF2541 family protein [Saprospiraceae bacterium]